MIKITEHLRKHKWKYILGVSVIACAGITTLIVRTHYCALKDAKAVITTHPPCKAVITTQGSFFNNIVGDNNVINVIERQGRGHPGYMIRHLETDLVYGSQKAAAKALDLDPVAISKHLNGRTEHVLGNHFERLILSA